MFLEILAAILIFVGGAFAVGATFTMSGVRALKMGARWKGSIFVAIGLTLAAPSAAWFVVFFLGRVKGRDETRYHLRSGDLISLLVSCVHVLSAYATEMARPLFRAFMGIICIAAAVIWWP